jgi:hypothetical protein
MLLTATSRQRVYQFRHERFLQIGPKIAPDRINGAGCNKSGVVGQGLQKEASQLSRTLDLQHYLTGCPAISAAFA